MFGRMQVHSLIILLCMLPLAASGENRIAVYYAGPVGAVRTALGIADELRLVDSPEHAEVLVLN